MAVCLRLSVGAGPFCLIGKTNRREPRMELKGISGLGLLLFQKELQVLRSSQDE